MAISVVLADNELHRVSSEPSRNARVLLLPLEAIVSVRPVCSSKAVLVFSIYPCGGREHAAVVLS